MGEPTLITFVSAAIFLYFGFYNSYYPLSTAPPLYALSVHGFTWMARTVGIGLLVVAGLSLAKMPSAELVNLVVSVIAAVGCLAIGVVWMVHNDGQWIFLLLFGLLNLSAVRASWISVQRMRR